MSWGNYASPVPSTSTFMINGVEISQDIAIALSNRQLSVNADGLLMLQQYYKKQLDFFKEVEMEVRKVCAKVLVEKPKEGVNTVELGNGYEAKVGIKYNYKLDADNDKIEATLNQIAAIGNEGAFIADRIVTWTPHFHVTEYRELLDNSEKGNQTAKTILDKVHTILTITDAAPSLEIKEPKKAKK